MLEAQVLGADGFSRVQGSPAKLQGAPSIPLRTVNPVTAKFQHNYYYECKKYLFSKPFHLDLTSGFCLVFKVTKKHRVSFSAENAL